VQFLVQDLVITEHTTYPKISHIGLVDLRYTRSRFFIFLFFMRKLSGKSINKLYKSCSVFHQESKKLDLHFSEFSTIFYRIYKIQHLHPRSRRNGFANRSSDFADRPSERKFRLQLGPWRHGRRRELDSGEGKAQLGRERAGEWCRLT
jgi:hypothetical protein